MIRQPLINPAMPGKVYEISSDGDHVLLDQAAGSAAEALEAARKAFPQFAHKMRVAILKQKPQLTTKSKNENHRNPPQRRL